MSFIMRVRAAIAVFVFVLLLMPIGGVVGRRFLVGRARSAPRGTETLLPSTRAEQLGLPADTLVRLETWREVEDVPKLLAQFETVFWEAPDTESLRALIRQGKAVEGKAVLEIGTGTGLLALCCLQAGAGHCVATDINPSAIANAAFNAELLGVEPRLDLRLVPRDRPGAYQVIEPGERFDLILSNPPWEDARAGAFAEYAFFDERFELLESILAGLSDHLRPGGKALLAYGCVSAIRRVQERAPRYGLEVRLLDERPLDQLPELFLPGMLLEVVPRRAVPGGSARTE